MRNAGTNFHIKRWLKRSPVSKFLCTLKKKNKKTYIYLRNKHKCSAGKMKHKGKRTSEIEKASLKFFLI